MLTFKGTIKVLFDTQQVSDKFRKREFVVMETGSPYPQEVIFQLVQEKVDLLEGYQVGDEIEVSFNLRGRAWTSPKDGITKYFNSLDAWKIARVGAGQQQPVSNSSMKPVADVPVDAAADDDLPF
ncbi:MAG: DUF3127 domain-containing protein [Flavobacteriales bacterium]